MSLRRGAFVAMLSLRRLAVGSVAKCIGSARWCRASVTVRLHSASTSASAPQAARDADLAQLREDLSLALGQGRFGTAVDVATKMRDRCAEAWGEKHGMTASALCNLALAQKKRGLPEEALLNYERALSIYRELHPEGTYPMAFAYVNLGLLQLSQGEKAKGFARLEKVDAARGSLEEAAAVFSKVLGSRPHPQALAVQVHLAAAARLQKKHSEARKLLEGAIASLRDKVASCKEFAAEEAAVEVGPLASSSRSGPGLGSGGGMGAAATAPGRNLAARALAEYETVLATALNNLGYLLKEKGEYEAATAAYDEALALREKLLDKRHPDVIATMHNIAELRTAAGHAAWGDEMRNDILERMGVDAQDSCGSDGEHAAGGSTDSSSVTTDGRR